MATIQLGEIGSKVIRRDSSTGAAVGTYTNPPQAVKPSPVSAPTSTPNIATKDSSPNNNGTPGLAVGKTNTGATIRTDGKGGIYIDNSTQSTGYYYNLDNPQQVYTKPETGPGAANAPTPYNGKVVVTRPGMSNSAGSSGGGITPSSMSSQSPQPLQQISLNEAVARVNVEQQRKMIPTKSTEMNNFPILNDTPHLFLEPSIYQVQTGTYTDKETGRTVPILETRYNEGIIGPPGKVIDRPATPEETAQFMTRPKEEIASTTPVSDFKLKAGEVKGTLGQMYYTLNQGLQGFGLNNERIDEVAKVLASIPRQATPLVLTNILPAQIKEPINKASDDFFQGAVSNVAKDIRDQPVKNLLLFGAGWAIGSFAGGAREVAGMIGPKAVKAFNFAEIGVSTGLAVPFVANTGKQIYNAKSLNEIGGILAVNAKDTLLFAGGYKAGGKIYEKEYFTEKTTPETNWGKDIIQPIVNDGEQLEVGKYKLETKTPKVDIYSDTPIKQWLRDRGVSERYAGPKLETTIEPKTIEQHGEVITKGGNIIWGKTVTGRPDMTLRHINLIGGSQKDFNIMSLDKLGLSSPELTDLDIELLRKMTGGFADYNSEYFKGGLTTKKIFRVSGADTRAGDLRISRNGIFIRFPEEGKTINRFSTTSSVSELIEKEGEFSIYKTRLGLKDITYPNFKTKGKIDVVYGFSRVNEPIFVDNGISEFKIDFIEKAEKSGPNQQIIQQVINEADIQKSIAAITSMKGIGVKELNTKSQQITNNAANYAKIKLAAQDLELVRVKSLPSYVGGGGMTYHQASYSQEYEIIEPLSKSLSIHNTNIKSYESSNFNNKPGLTYEEINKSLNKENNKEINKEINKTNNRSISKENTKEINKEINKEIQKELQKSLQKNLQKSLLKPTLKSPANVIHPKWEGYDEDTILPSSKSNQYHKGIESTGFRTFIKLKGKEVFLPGIRTRGEAERYGEKFTLSNLRATFGIKQTSVKLDRPDTNFKVRNDLFRNYRIKDHKRQPLNDTWIQRQTKRLFSKGEVSEIQRARRK